MKKINQKHCTKRQNPQQQTHRHNRRLNSRELPAISPASPWSIKEDEKAIKCHPKDGGENESILSRGPTTTATTRATYYILYAPKSPPSQSDYTGAEHTNTFSFVSIRLKFMSTYALCRSLRNTRLACPRSQIQRYIDTTHRRRKVLASRAHNHHWPGL